MEAGAQWRSARPLVLGNSACSLCFPFTKSINHPVSIVMLLMEGGILLLKSSQASRAKDCLVNLTVFTGNNIKPVGECCHWGGVTVYQRPGHCLQHKHKPPFEELGFMLTERVNFARFRSENRWLLLRLQDGSGPHYLNRACSCRSYRFKMLERQKLGML